MKLESVVRILGPDEQVMHPTSKPFQQSTVGPSSTSARQPMKEELQIGSHVEYHPVGGEQRMF